MASIEVNNIAEIERIIQDPAANIIQLSSDLKDSINDVSGSLMRLGILPILPKKHETNVQALERGQARHPGQRVMVVDPPLAPSSKAAPVGDVTSAAAGTEFDLMTATRTAPGDGIFTPPQRRTTRELAEVVTSTGVNLRHNLVWRSKQPDGFYHERQVGEVFHYNYPAYFTFKAAGSWDQRTPIVHPAVAGLDVTMAGFDEAYMRALTNLDMILVGRREENTTWIRTMVGKTIKRTFHPFRLLVRGAVLWTVLSIDEMTKPESRSWASVGQRPVPKLLASLSAYGGFAKEQVEESHDVLYVRCEDGSELFMVDVLQALASDEFPVTTDKTIAKLWPKLNRPRVTYNAPMALKEVGVGITAGDVYDTMTRFCDLHDCHDLWQEALAFVQGFLARPLGAGVLAGGNAVGIGLPASDLRTGALGPLLAGITAEGMKTLPLLPPDIHMYLYGGAVRGLYLTASYFEGLRTLADNQPIRLAVGIANHRHFQALASPRYSHAFVEKHVVPKARDCGWDCITESLRWAVPLITKRNFHHVLDAAKVPWWTSVMPHLPAGGGPFLSHWLLPASLNEQPDSGRWYACRILGMTTEDQVAAALRWAGAKLRYIVWHSDGSVKRYLMSDATPDRFLPRVQPLVIINKDVAQASVQFSGDVTATYELLRKLGQCVPELVYACEGDWENPVDYLLPEMLLPGAPSLPRASFPSAGGGQPEPKSEDREALPLGPEDADRLASIKKDYDIVMDDMLDPFDYERLAVDHPPLHFDAPGHLATVMAMKGVGWIKPDYLMRNRTVEEQIIRLRAYCHLASRAIDVANHLDQMDFIATIVTNRGKALGLIHHLEHAEMRRAKQREATPEPTDPEDISAVLKEGLGPKSLAEVHGAVDDPDAPSESLADFGPATSDPGSTSLQGAVGNVAETTGSEAVIGFLPPAASQQPPSA